MPLLKILGTRGYVVSLSSPSLVLPSCPYYIFPLFGNVYNSPRDWNLLYRKSICMHLSICKIGWEGGEGGNWHGLSRVGKHLSKWVNPHPLE